MYETVGCFDQMFLELCFSVTLQDEKGGGGSNEMLLQLGICMPYYDAV